MGSRARVFWVFLFASAAVMLTVDLIAAFGTPPWQDDGVPVSVANSAQKYPQIVSDGSEGAIVTWGDWRDYGTNSRDAYAQRVGADGNARWATDGVSVCVDSSGQYYYQIASDGLGGAIVTWGDRRSGSGNDDIYAQRVDDNGNALWQADGVSLCVAADYQSLPQIASDESGGAIVTWQDRRSGGGNYDIYAQRVYLDGTVWYTDGISICVAADRQRYPQIAPDGSGGAIVTWQDGRSGTDDNIYAQRVDSGGNAVWQADGVRACGAADDQTDPYLVYDGAEGAIVTWWDYRGSATDIYVQRVSDLIPTDFVRLPLVAKKYPG